MELELIKMKNILRILLVMGIVLGFCSGFQVKAEGTSVKNINMGFSGVQSPDTTAINTVWQGSKVYYGNMPSVWRVLDTDGFLFADAATFSQSYHSTTDPISWENSNLKDYLNTVYLNTNFTPLEKNGILNANLMPNPNAITLLTVEEAKKAEYGFGSTISANIERNMMGMWWLRTEFNTVSSASPCVNADGSINEGGVPNTLIQMVCPAFHLDVSKVVFTSLVSGGKNVNTVGKDSLQEALVAPNNFWKLTIDDERPFTADTADKTVAGGEVLSVPYNSATTGASNYISAIITNEAQTEILYYGKILDMSTNLQENGTVQIKIPKELTLGTYKLSLFSETCNGDYQTDYSSQLSTSNLNIVAPKVLYNPSSPSADLSTSEGGFASLEAAITYGNTVIAPMFNIVPANGVTELILKQDVSITNQSVGIMIPQGVTFTVPKGMTFQSGGNIINQGTIKNFGKIEVSNGSFFNAGTVDNDGTLENKGSIASHGVIKNTGIIINTGSLSNIGTIQNKGTITNDNILVNAGTIVGGVVNGTKGISGNKIVQTITAQNSYSKKFGDAKFKIIPKTDGDGQFLYSSNNTNVVTVDSAGNVEVKGVGTAQITVIATGTAKYQIATKTVIITVTKSTPQINLVKANYSVVYGCQPWSLGAKVTGDGALTYSSSNPTIATVDSQGKVTIKKCGKVSITIQAKATNNCKAAQAKTVTITIKPKKLTLSTVTSKKAKQVKVTWKKDTTVSGYEVAYSMSKNFSKNTTKSITIKSNNSTSTTIKNVKSKKNYYVKVRSYQMIDGQKVYGEYSKIKVVKVK